MLVTASVVVVTFCLMLVLEHFRPLRLKREPKPRRIVRNVTLGGIALVIAFPLQLALLVPAAKWIGTHRVGLLNVLELPNSVEVILGVALLDYTLWWWHWASHRVPLLWRFHLVHHVDRDMDTSTALRFHFGEHVLSVAYRAAQIALIGASPTAVWIWQLVLFVSILFHHSNVSLPEKLERIAVRLLVTPRMHAIHHSDRRDETDSNWSSLLSCWDLLHRTFRMDVPQETITIGVPAYDRAEDVVLTHLIAMPFVRQRRDWEKA